MADPFDYVESRADADELIQDFGAAVSLRRETVAGTEYDPTVSTTNYGTFAVKIEFSRKQLASGNVLDTDERWLVAVGPLAALGVTNKPASPDAIVTGDGRLHPILRCDPLSPAGVDVLYDCWIRY